MILWVAVCQAAEPAPSLLLRSETAVAVRPDPLGEPTSSVAQRLTLQTELLDHWTLAADGGVRQAPLSPDVRADLWQLQLAIDTRSRGVVLGRQHRLDPRGFLQLDGVTGRADDGGPVGVQGWAGRLWDAEIWDLPDVFVGGSQLTVRPTRGTQVDGGLEARSIDGDLQPRVFGAASADTVRGDRVWGVVETSDEALNARLDGSLVASRRLDLGAGLRWEGLAPVRHPRTPYELLAPDGYGIGEARARWVRGSAQLHVAGGPTWASDRLGAGARATASLATRRGASVAAFGRAAGIGGSALAGGGVEVRPLPTWVIDAALYGLQPLDGDAGLVWEVRGRGTTRAPALGAALDAAVYSDATLALGIRAGVALRAGAPPVPGTGGRP